MEVINTFAAKRSFSQLLARAEQGEEITIARNGKPIATLGPLKSQVTPVRLGDLRGAFAVPDDFDSWGEQDEEDWFGQ